MSKLREDVRSLLKYYVCRLSDEELKFNEEQRERNLTVCLRIKHNCVSKSGNNLLIVHTVLKNNIENLGPDFFYIKSQTVSHHVQKINLDSIEKIHITSIKTIITKPHSKCETVFVTLMTKDENGNLQKTQRWFTREIIDTLKEKYDFRPLTPKSQTEDMIDRVKPKVNNVKKTQSKNYKSDTYKKKDIYQKSNSTDEKQIRDSVILEPLKKPKKSFKKKFKNFMEKIFITSDTEPSPNPSFNRKQSSFIFKQCSTEFYEMEKEKPTNILAQLSMNKENETKNFEIIKDDIAFIDEEENENDNVVYFYQARPICSSDSFYHFNFSISTSVTRRRLDTLTGDYICTCDKRRFEIIVKYIETKLGTHKDDSKLADIDNFDQETRHFKNCQHHIRKSSNESPFDVDSPHKKRKGSVISFHSELHLDNIWENLKGKDEINCQWESVNYFINCKGYDEYQFGLSEILESDITLENLLLFFYLTRSIITQIDDPTCQDNEDIKRIMGFSETYFLEKYFVEIEKYKDLENFIRCCDPNMNAEVD